jgi:hypothetical protein
LRKCLASRGSAAKPLFPPRCLTGMRAGRSICGESGHPWVSSMRLGRPRLTIFMARQLLVTLALVGQLTATVGFAASYSGSPHPGSRCGQFNCCCPREDQEAGRCCCCTAPAVPANESCPLCAAEARQQTSARVKSGFQFHAWRCCKGATYWITQGITLPPPPIFSWFHDDRLVAWLRPGNSLCRSLDERPTVPPPRA